MHGATGCHVVVVDGLVVVFGAGTESDGSPAMVVMAERSLTVGPDESGEQATTAVTTTRPSARRDPRVR